jgi:hypothetical protein
MKLRKFDQFIADQFREAGFTITDDGKSATLTGTITMKITEPVQQEPGMYHQLEMVLPNGATIISDGVLIGSLFGVLPHDDDAAA